MKDSIAIVVVTYNRLNSLKRLLTSLQQAIYTTTAPLYISIDKGDNEDTVEYAKQFQWAHGEMNVIEHEFNLGLRRHILKCGELLIKHDAIIVLEDDLVVSEFFFQYALLTVSKYKLDMRIAGISLYGFQTVYHNFKPFSALRSNSDIYFMQNAQSWGEIWMKDQWTEFMKWYKTNDDDFKEQPHLPRSICNWKKSSWLKYHTKYCIEMSKYFVYPYDSFSSNVGEGGTHASFSSPLFIVPLRKTNLDSFVLSEFNDDSIIYDSFFENELIYKHLGLSASNLCIDLNGLKNNRENRRYWLTTRPANFKVIESFGLSLRPIEENVLNNMSGCDIFLYDTMVKEKGPDVDYRKLFYYMNGYDIAHSIGNIKGLGVRNYIAIMYQIFRSKLK